MPLCHSAHRCARITCPTCTWRHALHVSRRISASGTVAFYAVTLLSPNLSPNQVPQARIQLRNTIDHLRRRDRLWRDLSLNLWLTRTGNLRGIAALGTLAPQEVTEKLSLRWPMTLRPIATEDLRVEVYRTLRRVWPSETDGRQYQPVSIFVGPKRTEAVLECQNVLTHAADEPMPVLIG